MKLNAGDTVVSFDAVPLRFGGGSISDVFGRKNNKTLWDTVQHVRYQHLAPMVASAYIDFLNWKLGEFLLHLKSNGNSDYKRFLNKYGDLTYCTFKLDGSRFHQARGVYAYTVAGEMMYVGRCRDSMWSRVDNGYGRIHPKNCYLDGQATNCRLNALIAAQDVASVRLHLHAVNEDAAISPLESQLIAAYAPPWNMSQPSVWRLTR